MLFKDISKFEYNAEKLSLEIVEKDFNAEGGIFTVEGVREDLNELAREI